MIYELSASSASTARAVSLLLHHQSLHIYRSPQKWPAEISVNAGARARGTGTITTDLLCKAWTIRSRGVVGNMLVNLQYQHQHHPFTPSRSSQMGCHRSQACTAKMRIEREDDLAIDVRSNLLLAGRPHTRPRNLTDKSPQRRSGRLSTLSRRPPVQSCR